MLEFAHDLFQFLNKALRSRRLLQGFDQRGVIPKLFLLRNTETLYAAGGLLQFWIRSVSRSNLIVNLQGIARGAVVVGYFEVPNKSMHTRNAITAAPDATTRNPKVPIAMQIQ